MIMIKSALNDNMLYNKTVWVIIIDGIIMQWNIELQFDAKAI